METTATPHRPRAFHPDATNGRPVRLEPPGWDTGPERRIDDGRTLARALGWFSLGLGAAELFAARRLTDFLGVDDRHTTLVRLFGLREIATGAAILSQRTPVSPVQARVAGDALDLALLGAALGAED